MKNIINWTFGAFFRTLGRTFAFLLIGGVIGYFLLKSDIDISKFFPFMTVNAEVIYNANDNPTNIRSGVRGFNFSSTGPNYQGKFGIINESPIFNKKDVILNDTNDNECENGILRKLGIGGYKTDYWQNCATPPAMSDMAMFNQIDFYFGSNPLSNTRLLTSGYNYRLNILVASGPSVDISSDGWYYRDNLRLENAIYEGNFNGFDVTDNELLFFKKTNNGGNLTWLSLSYDEGTILNQLNIRGLGFTLYIPITQYIFNSDTSIASYGQKDWFYIVDYKLERVPSNDFNYDDSILTFDYPNVKDNIWQTEEYVYSNAGGSGETPDTPVTPDKPQETTNEDINNSINNDNIDDANNDATSFFDGFTSDDNGGLSGIITAPLNSINAMLSDSCTPLITSFKGKEIKLPCGTDFYNSMGEVRTFLNMLEGGFLSYMILRKLYFLIQRLKNPTDDRVEVMSL